MFPVKFDAERQRNGGEVAIMAYQDEYGIWRHDKPLLVNATVVYRKSIIRPNKHRVDQCLVCGGRLTIDADCETADYNEELAAEYGYTDANPFDDKYNLFTFITDFVECDTCDYWENCGREYYYNPKINNYDLPTPLTRRERIEAERLALEATGQMRLFAL